MLQYAKLDHRLEPERLFGLSSRICVSPDGRTHKRQGALPAFLLLRRSVPPRSMRHTILDISHANPFCYNASTFSIAVRWQAHALWPIQIVLIRVLSEFLQTAVVVMANINVGLAQLLGDLCKCTTLIEM